MITKPKKAHMAAGPRGRDSSPRLMFDLLQAYGRNPKRTGRRLKVAHDDGRFAHVVSIAYELARTGYFEDFASLQREVIAAWLKVSTGSNGRELGTR